MYHSFKHFLEKSWVRICLQYAFWFLLTIGVLALSVYAGFHFTFEGIYFGDDHFAFNRSRELFKILQGLPANAQINYAPLWDTLLSLLAFKYFAFLADPYWVRHAFTYSLFPFGLYILFVLLRRSGVSWATALLGSAGVFSIIRVGGHALFNVKDFPASITYVIVAVFIWDAFRRCHQSMEKGKVPLVWFLFIGAASVLPFLLRSPLLIFFPLTIGAVFAYGFFTKGPLDKRLTYSIAFAVLLSVGAICMLYISSPPMWRLGLTSPLESAGKFIQFYENIETRVLGQTYRHPNLPWWYPVVWLVIIAHPLLLITSVVGIGFALWKHKAVGHAFVLRTWLGVASLSLSRWLLFVSLLGFAAIYLVWPNLYDEERHLLFLFPPIFLWAVLQLDSLRDRYKISIAVVLIAASAYTYIGWGRYAYIYYSPLASLLKEDMSLSDGMGDYFGLCLPHAMYHIDMDKGPRDVMFDGSGYLHLALLQRDRFRNKNAKSFAPNYALHILSERSGYRENGWLVVTRIAPGRSRYTQNILEDVEQGIAKKLWAYTLPTGEDVCVLVDYRKT
jgi:hypothetical protein